MSAMLVRDRGRVVCLGNTAIELEHRTWFGKELEFLFTRAMGAGIYEPDYFTRGRAYQTGNKRGPPNGNIQPFLVLIARGRLAVPHPSPHGFPSREPVPSSNRTAAGELGQA